MNITLTFHSPDNKNGRRTESVKHVKSWDFLDTGFLLIETEGERRFIDIETIIEIHEPKDSAIGSLRSVDND